MSSGSTETTYDFFISFSNKDIEIVSEIVKMIDDVYHARCWYQTRDSKQEFVDAIIKGIEGAKAFLVFVSPDSAKSHYVLNEINHALEWKQGHEDYKVLPIIIGPEDIPYNDPVYKNIRFCLGRINMLFLNKMASIEELVLEIFRQTEFEIDNEELKESTYYIGGTETKRLKAQNDLLREFSKDFFDSAVKPDSLILDVGCANGNYILSHLQGRQYKGLLGIDIDSGLTDIATESYGSEKNVFVGCDALSTEIDVVLSDYLEDKEALGFDLIHISAMLLHVTEPVKLLQVLRRYLKRSGQLFIQDEDDGANVVHPTSRFFDLVFKIWEYSKGSGDRHCARKIPSYLAEAGYSNVRLAKCGVSTPGMNSEQKSALWDMYFNHHLWLAAEEDMFYHIDETNKLLEEYKSIYEEYKEQYDKGNIFIQLGIFFFIAQKQT